MIGCVRRGWVRVCGDSDSVLKVVQGFVREM